MINEGIGYLYTGYAAIALGWLTFIILLYMKQMKIQKQLQNLVEIINGSDERENILSANVMERNPMLPITFTAIVVLILLTALFISVPNQPHDEVNELLEKTVDEYNKEITVIGEIGNTVYENNVTNEIIFELVDREDHEKKIMIRALNRPDDMMRGKEVMVTGLLVTSNSSYRIDSNKIDMDVSINVNKIFATYTPIWLVIFLFLFYFFNKHKKINDEIAIVEKMVIDHGRKRKRKK
jgi:hypothetical protein